MNENAQNNSVLSSALEVATVGAAGYGIHSGMMSETARKFAASNLDSGGVKGLAAGAIVDYQDTAAKISQRWKGKQKPAPNVNTKLDPLMQTTNNANANSILNKVGIDDIKNTMSSSKVGPTINNAKNIKPNRVGPTMKNAGGLTKKAGKSLDEVVNSLRKLIK